MHHMKFISVLISCLFCASSVMSQSFSYNDIPAWGNISQTCVDGSFQSPIPLHKYKTVNTCTSSLKFHNYGVLLESPVRLENNRNTINILISKTKNGKRPAISGAWLRDKYVAINIHFHWGSENSFGSEHQINGRRFDSEIHIVHRNIRYNTTDEALRNRDGFVVLGILLKISDDKNSFKGLDPIFKVIPQLTLYHSTAQLKEPFALKRLLQSVNTRTYYYYKGSITIPSCSEAVTWIVYPDPIPIAGKQAIYIIHRGVAVC